MSVSGNKSVVCRVALRSDFPAMVEVWKEAFGDFSDYIENFFALHFKPGSSYVIETLRGEFLGAAHLVFGGAIKETDGSLRSCPYLYAFAVKSTHRGQGYGTALLRFVNHEARALGFRGTALCPERAELFAYYKHEGYTTELDRGTHWQLLSADDFDAWDGVIETTSKMLCTI
jgi:GNAT superfamily N-acetyltransferase